MSSHCHLRVSSLYTHDFLGLRRLLYIPDLWKAAAGKPVERVAISGLLYGNEYDPRTNYRPECVESADLSFPVVLYPNGHLLDGRHRCIKARQLGHTHVEGVRLSWEEIAQAVVSEAA
jgi:hypothetical protein